MLLKVRYCIIKKWHILKCTLLRHLDEEVQPAYGEADEDALVDVHRPVDEVAPEERQGHGQGADQVEDGVGDRLWISCNLAELTIVSQYCPHLLLLCNTTW